MLVRLHFFAALALTSLLGGAAQARCAAGYVVAMPRSGTLPANGQLVLEGNGRSAAWVAALEKATLVAPGHRVTLTAREHLQSAGAQQVVLVASTPLQVGKSYRLTAAGMTTNETSSLADASWTASEADSAPPTWSGAAEVSGFDQEQLGCGPSTFLHVKVPVQDASAVLLRASIEGGSTFFTTANDGVAELGHSMCGGPWVPQPDRHYSIHLAAFDAAGNQAAAPGAPLAIDTVGGDAGTILAPPAPTAPISSVSSAPAAPPPAAGGCATSGASADLPFALALGALLRRRRRTPHAR